MEANSTSDKSNYPTFEPVRGRITASMFGDVISASRHPNKRKISKLVDRIVRDRDLARANNPSLQIFLNWGLDHEKTAIETYCSITGNEVVSGDVWDFEENYFMAAAPDGIVLDWEGNRAGLVEIKCPYSKRDVSIKNHPPPYLVGSDMTLSPFHKYYHQVQGQLHATSLPWCDLVVWSPIDCHVTRVSASASWADENLPALTNFYEKYINHKSE